MYDSRLLGTWKSDVRKTAAEIEMRRDIRGKKKSKLLSLFGKLELRYTKTRVYTKYDDYEAVARYRVVAKDANSVATISENLLAGRRIFHIHFEGDHYWISLGRIREFFRRAGKKRMRSKR